MPFDIGNAIGFLQGLWGHPEKPFDEAGKSYNDWTNKATTLNSPYYNAGTGAIGDYQSWLQGQKDPSKFINNLMSGYSESPQAHNLQNQAMNAGINMGSASGLTGSSALAQQMQQNAGNIASGDMNSWLQNVLGINKQYGEGQNNLVNMGQNTTKSLTDMYGNAGQWNAENDYNKGATKQNSFWNTIASGLGMFGL